MKITQRIGRVIKPFVDVPRWMGYKSLAETTKSLGQILKTLFVPTRATRVETFAEAVTRLDLTEEIIAKRKKEFTRLMIIYLFIALGLFLYTFYLAWSGSIHGAIAGFIIMLVSLTMVFRYNFWLFQLKQRKLGCTLREWLNAGLLGDKK